MAASIVTWLAVFSSILPLVPATVEVDAWRLSFIATGSPSHPLAGNGGAHYLPHPRDRWASLFGVLVSSLATLIVLVLLIPAQVLEPPKEEVAAPSTSASTAAAAPRANAAAAAAGPSPELGRRQEPSLTRVWALTAINLAYGFSLALQGMLVAPLDAERLWPSSSSVALGCIAALCGLSQLVGPEAGHLSDAWRSPLGRRRPLILISVGMISTLTFSLWQLSLLRWRCSYIVAFLFQQVAWNFLYAAALGLVPDLVPAERQGFAGGASAANILLGALAAMGSVALFSHMEYHWHYASMVGLLLVSCTIATLCANERSSLSGPPARSQATVEESMFWRATRNYRLDVHRHKGFAYLLLTKTLYCAAITVKGFVLFFTQDTFRLHDHSAERRLTAHVAVTAEAAAAVAACCAMMVLDGSSSDDAGEATALRGGGKAPLRRASVQRGLVALFAGSAWMAVLWYGPLTVGWYIQHGFPEAGRPAVDAWGNFMVWGTAIWGAGQGLYLAGDQTLSFALLPDQEQAARYLSLNSLCACFGGCFGGAVSGCLLATLGAGASGGRAYSYLGYASIFVYASVLSVAIASTALVMWRHFQGDRTGA